MRASAAVLALALACAASSSHAAVIGIDLGGEFFKTSLVKPGFPLEIVLNDASKRKTPTMVGFHEGEQYFGNGAQNLITRKPLQTFAYMKLLMGKGIKTPAIQWLKDNHYPYEITANEERDTLNVAVPDGGGFPDTSYSVEELMGMTLSKARQLAEQIAEEPIKDCVITVPPFWSQDERAALLDAAELGGLKVLALMNENTAVAMKYAIDRKFENTKEHNVIFYDMGSTSLKTSFVTFSAYEVQDSTKNKTVESFEVKGVAWNEALGSHQFDGRLATRFAKEFDKKYSSKREGKSVFDSPRTMARLRKQAQRTKEVLSANVETPVTVEALTDDIDFRSHITREEFEKMNEDLIAQAMLPVEELLEKVGKKPEDVHAVVIVGGGARIPKIQEALKKTMKREVLNRNLNGDEAAALGAGFYAAGLSPAFRVRKISVQDIFPYGVKATVSRGANSASTKPFPTQTIFPKDSQMPLKKVLSFKRKEDFYVDVKYENPERLSESKDELIGHYNISDVAKAIEKNETEKPKITITFELTRSGMLEITKAEATVDTYKEEQVEVKKNETAANATDTEDAEKKEEKKDEKKEEEKKDDAEEKKDDAEEEKKEAEEEKEEEKVYETKLVKQTHRIKLSTTYTEAMGVTMAKEDKAAAKGKLKSIQKVMDDLRKLAKSKNDVEAHIFETRDHLEYKEELKKVMTAEEMDTIKAGLSEAEEWLWEEWKLEDYEKKYKDLKAAMAGPDLRKYELMHRDEIVGKAHEQLDSIKLAIKNETMMAEVSVNDTKAINDATTELDEWLAKKLAAQKDKKLSETPAFLSRDVYDEMEIHRQTVTQALRPKAKPKAKRKPKAKKKKKKKKKKAEGEEGDAAAAEETTDEAAAGDNKEEAAATDDTKEEAAPKEEEEKKEEL